MFSSTVGTSNPSAPINLPLERRHHALNYESPDGNVGCRAYPVNYEELYNLKGRLLTLIDATYTDPQQRKAQKDIVWQTLQAWMSDIEQTAGHEPLSIRYDENQPAQS